MRAKDWEDWIIFGGEMPKLLEDIPEVPMPKGYWVCLSCKKVTNYFRDLCEACDIELDRYEDE